MRWRPSGVRGPVLVPPCIRHLPFSIAAPCTASHHACARRIGERRAAKRIVVRQSGTLRAGFGVPWLGHARFSLGIFVPRAMRFAVRRAGDRGRVTTNRNSGGSSSPIGQRQDTTRRGLRSECGYFPDPFGLIGDGRAGRSRRSAFPMTAFFETPRRRPISAVERPVFHSRRRRLIRSGVQSTSVLDPRFSPAFPRIWLILWCVRPNSSATAFIGTPLAARSMIAALRG